MKTVCVLSLALLLAGVSHAQPTLSPVPPMMPPMGLPPTAPVVARNPANYLLHVEWKDAKGESQFLEVLTTEGQVEYDGLQRNSVKINNEEVPVTLKLTGTLTVLSEDKGRLRLFLGRTVPYVTGSHGSGQNAPASYSQMNVGLESTFLVKFDKPVAIQNDENGTITVLVKRLAD